MKRSLLAFVVLLFSAAAARAQFTTVSATITDPQGLRYSNGTVSIQLTTPGGTSPTLNGVGFTTSFGPLALDATGSFIARLADNNVVLPSGTRWALTVCPQAGSPCATTAPLLITGASQVLTGAINAVVGAQVSGFPTPFPSAGLTPTVLNVKDPRFGAKWDTQQVIDGSWSVGSNLINSATAPFLPSDVGKKIFAVVISSGSPVTTTGPTVQTIQAVNSASQVQVQNTSTFGGCAGGSTCFVTWGTDDSAALLAAANASSAFPSSVAGPNTVRGSTIYMPTGGGMISSQVFNLVSGGGGTYGPSVIGDGSDLTFIYVRPDTVFPGGGVPLFNFRGSQNTIRGFTVNGSGASLSIANDLVTFGCSGCRIEDVIVVDAMSTNATQAALSVNSTCNRCELLHVGAYTTFGANSTSANFGIAVRAGASNIDWYKPFSSNYFSTALITGVGGIGAASHVNFYGGLLDECLATFCTSIVNSVVKFDGTTIWSGGSPQFGAQVDGTSTATFSDSEIGPFDSPVNANGLSVLLGGTAIVKGTRMRGLGTGFFLNNAGTVIDAGGNTITGGLTGNAMVSGGTFDTVASLTPAAPAAVPGCSADVTATIAGSLTTDKVTWSAPATNVAGQIGQMWVSPAGTVNLRWCQFSGAAATPPGGNYRIKIVR